MNRTARLYALVEELRAAAPRPRTVAALAARFEVSTRTVQRDLQVLMETGVPVRATSGRGGGWSVDPEMTLPPIHFTPEEASALAVALATADAAAPYAGAARAAAQKIAVSMTGNASAAVRQLATRIVALPSSSDSAVRAAVEQALTTRTVLRLSYSDAAGRVSDRAVEPAGLLTADGRWYLIAWCRTRQARARLSVGPHHSSRTDHRAGPPPRPGRTAARLGRGRRGAAHHTGPVHAPTREADVIDAGTCWASTPAWVHRARTRRTRPADKDDFSVRVRRTRYVVVPVTQWRPGGGHSAGAGRGATTCRAGSPARRLRRRAGTVRRHPSSMTDRLAGAATGSAPSTSGRPRGRLPVGRRPRRGALLAGR
ncbi:helix-turn-helix transcriptional regulator [Streptomyces sp. NPDC101206]|uniref:helix-turn-helix transcriptional regulator n=1 Tax=Streptomyces sp. NPDC101206 TaxID=3366128 RepID=UPI0037F78320